MSAFFVDPSRVFLMSVNGRFYAVVAEPGSVNSRLCIVDYYIVKGQQKASGRIQSLRASHGVETPASKGLLTCNLQGNQVPASFRMQRCISPT